MRVAIFVSILFLSLCSFTPALFSPQGMGIEIIQGKHETIISLSGNDCGTGNLFVYDSLGELLAVSPLIDETDYQWSIPNPSSTVDKYSVYFISNTGW